MLRATPSRPASARPAGRVSPSGSSPCVIARYSHRYSWRDSGNGAAFSGRCDLVGIRDLQAAEAEGRPVRLDGHAVQADGILDVLRVDW